MLLCKVQYLLLDSQLNHLVLGGEYPINHTIYKQSKILIKTFSKKATKNLFMPIFLRLLLAIINLLILCEMVLVSILVQNAYKEIPEKQETIKTNVENECDINYSFK